MYYIQESDKPKPILKLFNKIKLDDDKIILPITKNENIEYKKAEKLVLKTKKILDKTNCNKVIISKNIKNKENFINCLYTYNMEIVDGKWLFEVLSFDAIEYIVKTQKLKKEELRCSSINK